MTVPDLKGLTVQEAQSQLSDQGLAVGTVEEVDDPDTEQGKIIDTNPGAGTSVLADSPRSTCAWAPARSTVPNVVGKSQSEAQTIIAGVNLQVETKFKATNDAPEGTVISQSPKDGTVDIGGTVKITVAQKPAPTLTPTTVTPTPTDDRDRPTATPPPTDRSTDTAPTPDAVPAASAGGDHPGDAGGVVHERAEADRALDGIRHAAQLRASWRASGGRPG